MFDEQNKGNTTDVQGWGDRGELFELRNSRNEEQRF